jgi:hypothetical protein
VLNGRRLRGPKLSTLVSVCLREDKCQRQQISRKKHDEENLKSGTFILERTRAFFTGRSDGPCLGAVLFEPCSGAARLGRCSTSTRRLSDIITLPDVLGGYSSGLRRDRGWTLASAYSEGHMNVRGSATPDEQ